MASQLFGNGLLITYCLTPRVLPGFLQDTSSSMQAGLGPGNDASVQAPPDAGASSLASAA